MANAQPPGRGPARSPLQLVLYWTAVVGVWGLIFVVAFFAVFAWDLPDTSKLYDVKRQPSISYLDRSGALVAVRGSQYAPPINLDKLPPYVPKAFIAIEDRRFYAHTGFDAVGIARALVADISQGRAQGASTITQQLAKNLFLAGERSLPRKAFSALKVPGLQVPRPSRSAVNTASPCLSLVLSTTRYFASRSR